MSLTQRLTEYISACFTGLWIECHEHDDALARDRPDVPPAELAAGHLGRRAGLADSRAKPTGRLPTPVATDPLAAIRSLNALASPDSSALLVLVELPSLPGNRPRSSRPWPSRSARQGNRSVRA